jgi:hypothetical protein
LFSHEEKGKIVICHPSYPLTMTKQFPKFTTHPRQHQPKWHLRK